jgi:hypothetical protein
MYEITSYTKRKALKLGVKVKPSIKPGKKIDVYKNGKLITSIGAKNYGDYGTYLKYFGLEYANKRRKLYKLRHNKYRNIKGSASYYADQLLW